MNFRNEDVRPKKLFQFWDTKHPPDEVVRLLHSWEIDSNFDYQLFDVNMAASLIEQKFSSRVVDAFNRCAVPAMQADLFRYCALYVYGGVYVDADTENSGKLKSLLIHNQRGTLMKRRNNIANDFLFVNKPHDKLLNYCILKAVSNIESKVSMNVWIVTGPGIMTHAYLSGEEKHLFDGFIIEPVEKIREFVWFRQDLSYKKTRSDWRNFLDNANATIFK